ncbi:MAG: hypothetical protein FWH22_02660 [Fibromonadales bacterium]|nr:hypothetical protein [Fibromonadales bacterium]
MNQRISLAAYRRSILSAIFAMSFFACSDGNKDNHKQPSYSESLLLNFTSDFETGELRWMGTDEESLSAASLSFDQDSKVAVHNEKIFVLEKNLSNLNCLNPQTIGDKSTIVQRSLESGSNPYDVAVVGNKGFIALYSLDYLQIFDANTCELGGKIDLPISGANASSINAYGDTLLVLSQRLENYMAVNPGLLILISASTGNVINTIELNFYNPHFSLLKNEKLFIASLDYFGAEDGIEVLDLKSGQSEVLYTGSVSSMALDESTQTLYASVYVSWGDAPVKPINLSNKSVGANLPSITDAYSGLVFDSESKRLFIADAGGLKIYDTETKTTTAVSNDLPPYSLAIVRW